MAVGVTEDERDGFRLPAGVATSSRQQHEVERSTDESSATLDDRRRKASALTASLTGLRQRARITAAAAATTDPPPVGSAEAAAVPSSSSSFVGFGSSAALSGGCVVAVPAPGASPSRRIPNQSAEQLTMLAVSLLRRYEDAVKAEWANLEVRLVEREMRCMEAFDPLFAAAAAA